jgi:hypothetical protein
MVGTSGSNANRSLDETVSAVAFTEGVMRLDR